MLQSGGILGDLIAAKPQGMVLAGKETLKKVYHQHQNQCHDLLEKQQNIILIKEEFASRKGSGITLTNNEIKDIVKVIKSSENRGILLKRTIRKAVS